MAEKFEETMLELELRPGYIEKDLNIHEHILLK